MSVIDDYLLNLNKDQRDELERIRNITKEMVSDAQEVISYGIPTMDYKGKHLLHFAAFKDHLSLFPTSKPIKELEDQLKPFISAKGTLKFTAEKPIPEKLIRAIVQSRLNDIDQKS